MSDNTNSLDEKLLIAYIGNNYEKIIQKKFSIPALFLSWIYTLYRKIYIPSIIGMIAVILLGFLPDIIYSILAIVFAIILGINFNKWYIVYAQKKVQKIKTNNPNANENELIDICTKKGGTNIWLAIVIYAVFIIVSGFLNFNVSQLYNFNENLENYKGTWYINKNNNLNVPIENDELNIKTIENNTITFDYTFSGLCGEKNISVEINNNIGTFKTQESSGTIEFKDNTVILKVKNINYNETFERTFITLNNDNFNLKNKFDFENVVKNSNIEVEVNSNDEILNIGQNYYKYAYETLWCNAFEYGASDKEEYAGELLNYKYVRSYFTSNAQIKNFNKIGTFEEMVSSIDMLENRYYDSSKCGRGANTAYSMKTKLEILEETNTRVVFNAYSYYCESTNNLGYCEENSTDILQNIPSKFIIECETLGDSWKISYFELPN